MLFVLLIIALALCIIAMLYWLLMSPWSQVCGRVHVRLTTSEKIVALTFDDGPNDPYTTQLLDILAAEQVRVTFFVVGENAANNPAVIQRMHAEGHIVGNHSLSHQFSLYFRDRFFRSQIDATQDIVKRIIGVAPLYYRSPWLFRTPWLLRTVRERGLVPVWGVFGSEREIAQGDPKKIADRAFKKVRPGTILIFHDGFDNHGGFRGSTVAAIALLIPELKKAGYRFVTVDALQDKH